MRLILKPDDLYYFLDSYGLLYEKNNESTQQRIDYLKEYYSGGKSFSFFEKFSALMWECKHPISYEIDTSADFDGHDIEIFNNCFGELVQSYINQFKINIFSEKYRDVDFFEPSKSILAEKIQLHIENEDNTILNFRFDIDLECQIRGLQNSNNKNQPICIWPAYTSMVLTNLLVLANNFSHDTKPFYLRPLFEDNYGVSIFCTKNENFNSMLREYSVGYYGLEYINKEILHLPFSLCRYQLTSKTVEDCLDELIQKNYIISYDNILNKFYQFDNSNLNEYSDCFLSAINIWVNSDNETVNTMAKLYLTQNKPPSDKYYSLFAIDKFERQWQLNFIKGDSKQLLDVMIEFTNFIFSTSLKYIHQMNEIVIVEHVLTKKRYLFLHEEVYMTWKHLLNFSGLRIV